MKKQEEKQQKQSNQSFPIHNKIEQRGVLHKLQHINKLKKVSLQQQYDQLVLNFMKPSSFIQTKARKYRKERITPFSKFHESETVKQKHMKSAGVNVESNKNFKNIFHIPLMLNTGSLPKIDNESQNRSAYNSLTRRNSPILSHKKQKSLKLEERNFEQQKQQKLSLNRYLTGYQINSQSPMNKKISPFCF